MLDCPKHGFCAGIDSQFCEYAAKVRLNCAHTQKQRLGDIFVGMALGKQCKDFGFSFGKLLGPCLIGWLGLSQRHQALYCDFRRQDDLSPPGGYDRPREVPD